MFGLLGRNTRACGECRYQRITAPVPNKQFGEYSRQPEQITRRKSMANASDISNLRMADSFSKIYENDVWNGGSGPGSTPSNTIDYSAFLQKFISYNGVRSVVDVGCGDWQFSRYIDWSSTTYYGFDIVPKVIERNKLLYENERVKFALLESIEMIPSADLIVCKDVLQHIPNSAAQNYISVMKSKAKFLIITNDIGPTGTLNTDIEPGGWRALQLNLPPFSENAPIILEWTVHMGQVWTRKATYLFAGHKALD
jgi:SAM-dependent methyltransferase